MKIAFVHDFLLHFGGAESVLKTLVGLYPQAPVYTLLADIQKVGQWLPNCRIEQSFLQYWPEFFKKRYRYLLPLMPTAPETFNLRNYDLVISSSSGFAKGVVLKPKTKHLCYMHAPMRYVWDWHHQYLEEQRLKGKRKLAIRFFLNYLRMWDRASIERVDYLVANSRFTADRIRKYYKKDATVIYPPVEVEKYLPTAEHRGYFLTIGRLTPNKRINLIVDTFNKLKLPLVVAGTGEQKRQLEKMVYRDAKIKILGWVDEKRKIELMQGARAFVFAAEDDFGMAMVEAMAAGKPVIAFRGGGAEEIVQEGKTGEFFKIAQMELLADGVRRFIEKEKEYNYLVIRKRAEYFSRERFVEQFNNYVSKKILAES